MAKQNTTLLSIYNHWPLSVSEGYDTQLTFFSKSILVDAPKEPWLGIETDKVKAYKIRKKDILKRILRFSKRLNYFLENNIWEVRKTIKLTDEDKKLQDLLIALNKEIRAITYEYQLDMTGIDNQINDKSKCFEELNIVYNKVIEIIQKELKKRCIRREKRKITFILDA